MSPCSFKLASFKFHGNGFSKGSTWLASGFVHLISQEQWPRRDHLIDSSLQSCSYLFRWDSAASQETSSTGIYRLCSTPIGLDLFSERAYKSLHSPPHWVRWTLTNHCSRDPHRPGSFQCKLIISRSWLSTDYRQSIISILKRGTTMRGLFFCYMSRGRAKFNEASQRSPLLW